MKEHMPVNTSVSVNPGLEGVVVGSTSISLVNGEEGRLTYRGYDIADLAAHASFEEVAYLLWHGALPTAAQLDGARRSMSAARALQPAVVDLMRAIQPNAWPMDVLRTAISTVGTFVPPRPD